MITIATYDKLVRDRIPEIIEASGKSCRTSISTGEELIQRLQSKLVEEFNEFVESGKDLEELADILEVIDGLAYHLGSSLEEIMEIKNKKRDKRGGFEKGICLEWVED
jgi:predicted house-cleaning noncanonical NTP pyrophosphatase (MazG superfamily)